MVAKRLLVNISVTIISIVTLLGSLEYLSRVRDRFKIEHELESLIKDKGVSDKTFNIYCFGESTMEGAYYGPSLTIPKLLSYMLDNKIQTKDMCSINIAQGGRDLEFNLNRLKVILREKNIFRPSLCIIYSGHNEFLKYHEDAGGFHEKRIFRNGIIDYINTHSSLGQRIIYRIAASKVRGYKLEIDERHLFDQPLFERNIYKKVFELYQDEIMEIVGLSRKYGVPCIISTVAENYADWEPNRSIWYADDSDKEKYKGLMDRAKEAQDNQIFDKAMGYYLKAISLNENFAETHYRLGKFYEMQKKYAKAWEEYNKALDYDGMPIRATRQQNDFIRKIQEEKGVFTVDAVDYLRKNSEHQLIGYNLMIDGHHPNISGYILISKLIAEKISQVFHEGQQPRTITEEEAKKIFNLNNKDFFNVYNDAAVWHIKLASWRYDPSERLRIAEKYFLNAMAIDASRYEPYFGIAISSFLRKDTKKAEKYLARARTINPDKVSTRLKESWLKQVIDRAYKNHNS